MDKRFWVVKKVRPTNPNRVERVTVHTFDLEKGLSNPIWHSRKIPFSRENCVSMAETPVSIAPLYISGGDCYLGLNNGSVHQVACADIPRHRAITTFPSRFSDYQVLRDRARGNEEHMILSGARSILSLVNFNGDVYDASFAGLFETESGRQIDNRRISSAGVYGGKLCVIPSIPTKMDIEKGQTFQTYQTGSLIDVFNGQVVLNNLTPFDGSGFKQGEYLIHGDRAFIHHGDWPDEKITIREFPSGNVLDTIQIPTTQGFILHQDQVYDFRDLRQIDEDGAGLMKSEIKGRQIPLFRINGYYTSAVSAGDAGIIIAYHDGKSGTSKLVSHLEPEKPLYESRDHLTIYST